MRWRHRPSQEAGVRPLVSRGQFCLLLLLTLIGIFEVGVIVASTGGLPNVYINLYYPLLAVASFSSPLPVSVALALLAGMVPSHQGFLNAHLLGEEPASILRPLSFIAMSSSISLMSSALRHELRQITALAKRLTEEVAAKEKAQRALKDSQDQLRLLLDHVQDMVLLIDRTGQIQEVNPAVEQLMGYSRQELLKRHISTVLEPAVWREIVNHEGRNGPEGAKVGPMDVQIVAAEGRRHIIEVTAVPAHQQGQIQSWIITAHDVTPQRQAEEMRTKTWLRLLATQEEERKRVGYDFHDGPMQLIASALSLMQSYMHRSGRKSPLLERAFNLLSQALEEARDIITHLIPKELAEKEFPKAIASLLAEVEKRHNIGTELEVGEGRWEMSPLVGAHLFRIVQEAINNAVKHSQTPRIKVRLWQDKEKMWVSVQDWGIGLVESPQNGTLGLKCMRDRAKILKGEMEIISSPGMGAEVRFNIPLAALTQNQELSSLSPEVSP